MLTFSRAELPKYLPKHGVVAELGVDKGDYSKVILEHNQPKNLFLIDSWTHMLTSTDYDAVHSKKYEDVKNLFDQHQNVTILKKDTNEAINDFADQSFDWIYIDADHHYEPCLNDLRTWSNKVKDDGYICGNDFITRPKKGFGVNEAVTEFVAETKFFLCGTTNESNFQSFVISKTASAKQKFLSQKFA